MAPPTAPNSALKKLLVEKVQQIPGVSHKPWPGRDDGFSTLHFQDVEIAHFHNFHEIDLRLGRKLIKRENLKHYPDSIKHPKRSVNSIFIERRFADKDEVEDIVRLVRLAVENA